MKWRGRRRGFCCNRCGESNSRKSSGKGRKWRRCNVKRKSASKRRKSNGRKKRRKPGVPSYLSSTKSKKPWRKQKRRYFPRHWKRSTRFKTDTPPCFPFVYLKGRPFEMPDQGAKSGPKMRAKNNNNNTGTPSRPRPKTIHIETGTDYTGRPLMPSRGKRGSGNNLSGVYH